MYNQKVVKDGQAWNYSPLKYWPMDNSYVSFFAYSPFQSDGMTSNNYEGDPCIDFKIDQNIGRQKDLVYANAIDLTRRDGMVNLQFKHALSRIGYKGMHTLGDDTYVEINSITLNSSVSGATLNLFTGEWSNPQMSEQSYKLTSDTPLLAQKRIIGEEAIQLNAVDGYMMVLPTIEENQYEIVVDYTVCIRDSSLVGGVYEISSIEKKKIGVDFQGGKSYNILLKIGGEEGFQKVDFSTEIWDWDKKPDTGVDLGRGKMYLEGFDIVLESENNYTAECLVKKSDAGNMSTNILKGLFEIASGTNHLSSNFIDYSNVEPGEEYVFMDFFRCQEIKELGTVKMDLSMMQITIETDSFFEIPMLGEEECQFLIAWGDGSQSLPMSEIWWEEAIHRYSSPGRYEVRVFSTETDPTECQIPMFNVYSTHGSEYWGAENLISIDTPLLYHPSENTSRIFWGAVNLESVHQDVFMHFKRTESFYEAFLGCKSLQQLPIGLFKHNRNAYNFASAFSYCEMLYDFEWIFVENEDEKATRFSDLERALYVFHMFQNVGRLNADLCLTKKGLNFDEYDYPHGVNTGSSVYGDSAAKFQNYEEIEKFYYFGD